VAIDALERDADPGAASTRCRRRSITCACRSRPPNVNAELVEKADRIERIAAGTPTHGGKSRRGQGPRRRWPAWPEAWRRLGDGRSLREI